MVLASTLQTLKSAKFSSANSLPVAVSNALIRYGICQVVHAC